MATEADELRLTVSLVDNASAGLRSLQGQMQQLGGGQTADHMQRFKRESHSVFEELEKAGKAILPEFARGVSTSTSALVSFGLGLTGVGVATGLFVKGISETITGLRDFSKEMINLNNVTRETGQSAAQIHAYREAFARWGVDAATADRNIQGAAHSMADLTRARSALREEMLRGIMDEPQRAAMERALTGLSRDDMPTFINDVKGFLANVRENVFKHQVALGATADAAAARAAEAVKKMAEAFGVPDIEKLGEALAKVSDEEDRLWKERVQHGIAFDNVSTSIGQKWDKITNSWKDRAIVTLLPIMEEIDELMKSSAESSEKQRGAFEGIGTELHKTLADLKSFYNELTKIA